MEKEQGGGVETGGVVGRSEGEALSCRDSCMEEKGYAGMTPRGEGKEGKGRRGAGMREGAVSCQKASIDFGKTP
jgi:hypothetical protein